MVINEKWSLPYSKSLDQKIVKEISAEKTLQEWIETFYYIKCEKNLNENWFTGLRRKFNIHFSCLFTISVLFCKNYSSNNIHPLVLCHLLKLSIKIINNTLMKGINYTLLSILRKKGRLNEFLLQKTFCAGKSIITNDDTRERWGLQSEHHQKPRCLLFGHRIYYSFLVKPWPPTLLRTK